MTPGTYETAPAQQRRLTASWLILAAVSVLALLAGLYVAVTPAGAQTDLVGRTFDEFAAQDPEVAGLFSMQLVLVGVIDVAFTLLVLVVAVVPYRAGRRWAWFALWLLPIAFGLATLRMLVDGYEVGYFYLLLTTVAVVGLLLPGGRFLRAEVPERGP